MFIFSLRCAFFVYSIFLNTLLINELERCYTTLLLMYNKLYRTGLIPYIARKFFCFEPNIWSGYSLLEGWNKMYVDFVRGKTSSSLFEHNEELFVFLCNIHIWKISSTSSLTTDWKEEGVEWCIVSALEKWYSCIYFYLNVLIFLHINSNATWHCSS